jgi:hypothetical protein
VNEPTKQTLEAEVKQVAQRAFGEENRKILLDRYFANAEPVNAKTAWQHIYRLLLWIDRTTGLAHCYESDKCQPGRPWYARTLAFHVWLARALDTTAQELGNEIDLLFQWAIEDLTATTTSRRAAQIAEAQKQRRHYAGAVPLPGQDPGLIELITTALSTWLSSQPPAEVLRELAERIRTHVSQENKRKNLVGEGFEDTLAAVLRRIPLIADQYKVLVRPLLHDLPGFHQQRSGDKPRQVDLALVRTSDNYRNLISCKWSVRSDREEQFRTDFESYDRLESAGKGFGYTLITNEFDPARLAAACDNRRGRDLLFTSVVHVNPDGPRAAYSAPVPTRGRGIPRAIEHLHTGRLASMRTWLEKLSSGKQ